MSPTKLFYHLASSSCAILVAAGMAGPVQAQETTETRLARLEALVAEQASRLARQEELLAQRAGQSQGQQSISEEWRVRRNGVGAPDARGAVATAQPGLLTPLGDSPLGEWRAGQAPQTPPTGPDAPTEQRAELAAIPEGMAVLSRQGGYSFDLSAEYTRSSANRLVFRGIEIVPGIQIGVIEANEADRDTYGVNLGGRFGVTNRLEVDFRVPYIARRDTITTVQQRDEAVTRTIDLEGSGVGDVEVGARYQINRGQRDRPIFVAGLRVKSNTGEGPFDIPRDEFGVASRLAVGSGFWGVEPSVSMLLPSDPAVIFANVSYFAHLPRDINQVQGDILIGRVDPGDSVGLAVGFGFAINPRFSYSLGYRHNYIMPTSTELNDTTEESDALQVGALLFGLSYRVTERFTLNGNFEFGVTGDAPDMRFVLRVPLAF